MWIVYIYGINIYLMYLQFFAVVCFHYLTNGLKARAYTVFQCMVSILL